MASRRLYVTLGICACAFVVCAVQSAYSLATFRASGQFIVEPAVSFGNVKADELLFGSVTIKNDTRRNVLIDNITASCGCLTIGNAIEIPTRKTESLSFNVRTPSQFGYFRHEIRFRSGNTIYITKVTGKVTDQASASADQ